MPNLSSGNEPVGPSLLHQAFLARASDTPANGSADLALGAFLTLRMVDQFGAGAKPNRDALNYQVRATWDFVQNLPGESPELNHLRQIARVGEQVLKRSEPRFLWSPMLAFAYWLEQELRLEESLDVLDTVLGLETQTDSAEQLAAHLQRGRVLRVAGDFDGSTAAYEAGGTVALRLEDGHSARVSRVGCAIVQQKVGNLREAGRMLGEVITEAQAVGDQDAEAHAYHDLANNWDLMGQPEQGVPCAFRAYELYQQPTQRMEALQVVGLLMKNVGNREAARDAFAVVLAGGPPKLLELNTMLELLELAVLNGDRVAFERWRRELEARVSGMPADAYVDLATKLGQGYAAFGQLAQARELLESAVRRAEQHRLNKYLFRAETVLRSLTTVNEEKNEGARPRRVAHLPEVDEVAEKLQLLRASA